MKLEFEINTAERNNTTQVNKIYKIKIIYLVFFLIIYSPNTPRATASQTDTESNTQDQTRYQNQLPHSILQYYTDREDNGNTFVNQGNSKTNHNIINSNNYSNQNNINTANGSNDELHTLKIPCSCSTNSLDSQDLNIHQNDIAKNDIANQATKESKTSASNNNLDNSLQNIQSDQKSLKMKHEETRLLFSKTDISINTMAQNLEQYTEEELIMFLKTLDQNIEFECILRATGSTHLSQRKSQLILESFTHPDHYLLLSNKMHELFSNNQYVSKVKIIIKGILKLSDNISQHNIDLILKVLNSLNKTICQVFIEYICSSDNSDFSDNHMEKLNKTLLLEKLLKKSDDKSVFKITYDEYIKKLNEDKLKAISQENQKAKEELKKYYCC